jgi:glycosyltransferase involved in cell wall biosynthesis
MRIVFVIHELSAGGAERVVSLMAGHWHAAGHEVSILSYDDGSRAPFYHIPEGVRLKSLGIVGVPRNFFDALAINVRRLSVLRRAIKDAAPDVVIAFLHETNVQTILATRGLGVPVIVSERSNPAFNTMGRVWRMLLKPSYRFASGIVLQTQKVKEHFSWMPPSKLHVVPNPVSAPKPAQADPPPPDMLPQGPYILAVGRLIPLKGFDVLLRAFAQAAEDAKEWKLVFVGEGKERAVLEAQAQDLRVEDRVFFTGRVKDVGAIYAEAEIFVLSSFFEGFPNVLCEAMAHGLPVIAANCDYGPADIVRPGIDGLLVPVKDEQALAEALQKLMGDEKMRCSMGERTAEIIERFGMEKIMERWNQVLARVMKADST